MAQKFVKKKEIVMRKVPVKYFCGFTMPFDTAQKFALVFGSLNEQTGVKGQLKATIYSTQAVPT